MLGFKEQKNFINAVTRTGNTKGMNQCIKCNEEESSTADSNLNYWVCCDMYSFRFHCKCLGLHFCKVEPVTNIIVKLALMQNFYHFYATYPTMQ